MYWLYRSVSYLCLYIYTYTVYIIYICLYIYVYIYIYVYLYIYMSLQVPHFSGFRFRSIWGSSSGWFAVLQDDLMNGPQRVLPKLPDVLPNFLTADSEGSWDLRFVLVLRQKRPRPPKQSSLEKTGNVGCIICTCVFDELRVWVDMVGKDAPEINKMQPTNRMLTRMLMVQKSNHGYAVTQNTFLQ
jgi:hypothetical protein